MDKVRLGFAMVPEDDLVAEWLRVPEHFDVVQEVLQSRQLPEF